MSDDGIKLTDDELWRLSNAGMTLPTTYPPRSIGHIRWSNVLAAIESIVAARTAARLERVRALADGWEQRAKGWTEVSEDDKDAEMRRRAARLASEFSSRSADLRAALGEDALDAGDEFQDPKATGAKMSEAADKAWTEYANRRHMHSHARIPSKDFLAGFAAGGVAALEQVAAQIAVEAEAANGKVHERYFSGLLDAAAYLTKQAAQLRDQA